MATLSPPVSISLENEKNPWLSAAARFDEAAARLKLDDGMRKVLGAPAREITVHIPVQLDDGEVRGGQHPVRRREGRRHLRPPHPFGHGARKDHPPLHGRDHCLSWARA